MFVSVLVYGDKSTIVNLTLPPDILLFEVLSILEKYFLLL